MAQSKPLLLVGLLLAGGAAEAQKTQSAAPAPAATPAPEAAPAPAAAAAPAAGAETMVSAANPQGVVDAMLALGYTATLGTDTVGDPMISGVILGTNYSIFFYGCVENANCQSLLFQAGYDLQTGWTLEAANAWNAGKILTDAYLNEEMDPFLEFFVTTAGGLTQANFADVLDWWQVTLIDFETTIGF